MGVIISFNEIRKVSKLDFDWLKKSGEMLWPARIGIRQIRDWPEKKKSGESLPV